MNSNAFKGILIIGIGLMLSLFLMANVLTSGGNVVSNFYRYIPVAFFILGFASPSASLYLMSLCIVGIGYLKKTMVLDGYFSFDSLYFVVGAPAILLLGMCASTFLRLIFSAGALKREWLTFVGGVAISLALMGFVALKGSPVQLAIMVGAYANILWVLPLNVRNEIELGKLLRFTLVLMILSSSVGYYQAIFGLTELDRVYVELGYADESEGATGLTGGSFRPFATYGSSNAFGWSMLFAASVAFTALVDARRRNVRFFGQVCWGILIAIALGGLFISTKKAPIVALAVLPAAVAMVKSRKVGAFMMLFFVTIIWSMFQFPTEIRVWCKEQSADLKEIHPALTLNTINTRLESFEALQEPGTVALIGPGNTNAHSHTMISSLMITIGYIPFALLVASGVFFYFWGQRRASRLFGSWKLPRAQLVAIELGFFLTLAAGGLLGTGVYQSFPGAYIWWLVVAYSMVRIFNHFDETQRLADAAAAKDREASEEGELGFEAAQPYRLTS